MGAWVKRGVMNIWPVKPFETLMVIKGYTIELNSIYEYYPAVAVLTYLKYELR